MAQTVPEIRYLLVGPSNAHELEIARIVDQFSTDGGLSLESAAEVIAALRFIPSKTDIEFVKRYILWRIETPVWSKSSCALTVAESSNEVVGQGQLDHTKRIGSPRHHCLGVAAAAAPAGTWPRLAPRSASSSKRSTTKSACTRRSATCHRPSSSETTRMPLRGSFLYEFSQASGNLSIRWRRRPCGQCPRSSSG